MFEIGDKVVYGVVGVCEVENIDTDLTKNWKEVRRACLRLVIR